MTVCDTERPWIACRTYTDIRLRGGDGIVDLPYQRFNHRGQPPDEFEQANYERFITRQFYFEKLYDGFCRMPVELNAIDYKWLSHSWVRDFAFAHMRRDMWTNEDKIEAALIRHDGQWNKDFVALGRGALLHHIETRMCDGLIDIINDTEALGHRRDGIVPRLIAAADWVNGDPGKAVLSRAEELNRGSAEEIRTQILNRLMMLDRVVSPTDTVDTWAPSLGLHFQSSEDYYLSRFAFDADKEPADSFYVTRNVQDENALRVYLAQGDGAFAVAEPSGNFWIAAGSVVTLIAVDAAGNARKATISNESGTISLTELEGPESNFTADIGGIES